MSGFMPICGLTVVLYPQPCQYLTCNVGATVLIWAVSSTGPASSRAGWAGGGSLRLEERYDAARDVGVLVEMVAGTHAVVPVRDLERIPPVNVAAHEQDRGQGLVRLDLGDVLGDVDVLERQVREPRRAQDVLRFVVLDRRAPQALDEHVGGDGIRDEREVGGGSGVVVLIGFVLPAHAGHGLSSGVVGRPSLRGGRAQRAPQPSTRLEPRARRPLLSRRGPSG